MLEYIFNMKSLPFMEICQVYMQSLSCEASMKKDVDTDYYWQEENDLYQHLNDFFASSKGVMAIWRTEAGIQSVLRLEGYGDGQLLCSLETRPESRRKGFATMLVKAVLADLQEGSVVYSHVKKDNSASMQLHLKCGFTVHSDIGKLLDGSISDSYVTLKFIKK